MIEMIKNAARSAIRNPHNARDVSAFDLDRAGVPGMVEWYEFGGGVKSGKLLPAGLAAEREAKIKVCALADRYRRFKRYMIEDRHDWQEVPGKRVYYMDNAVEILERSKLGFERRREIVPPHGDVCF